eukprot:3060026-Rhodomonas_salina.1
MPRPGDATDWLSTFNNIQINSKLSAYAGPGARRSASPDTKKNTISCTNCTGSVFRCVGFGGVCARCERD